MKAIGFKYSASALMFMQGIAAYSSFVGRSSPSSGSYFANHVTSQIEQLESESARLSNANEGLVMRVKRKSSRTKHIAGSSITQANYDRVKAAGRKGTKRFVDPNKLFVGNLSYSVTSKGLKEWFNELGLGDQLIACKVISDWKTQKSKGYGFAQFSSPLYATSAMEFIRGKTLQGRVVRLDQGKKKEAESVYLVKQKSEVQVEEEEDAIIASSVHFEEPVNNKVDNDEKVEEDDDDYDDDDGIISIKELMMSVEYEDFDDNDLDGEDDDFEYDGVFEEEYEDVPEFEDDGEFKNREQRRKEASANKRRKKKGRGFGKT